MNTKRRALYLAVAIMVLTQSGCLAVAAGVAGGAALGAAYYCGKDCRSFPASSDDTVAATKAALADLGMPVVGEQIEGGEVTIKSQTSDGDPVRIYLHVEGSKFPADGPLSKVTVRVATFGDHPVSNRVLDQISAHLAPAGMASVPPPGAVLPASGVGGPSAITVPGKPPAVSVAAPTAPPPGAFPPTTAPPPELPPGELRK